jgi:hypothetical protein
VHQWLKKVMSEIQAHDDEGHSMGISFYIAADISKYLALWVKYLVSTSTV